MRIPSNMHKRLDKSNDREHNIPAKRPRYNGHHEPGAFAFNGDKNTGAKKNAKSEDIWGCDFEDDDIQEMDFIASQASIQENNDCSQAYPSQMSQQIQRNNDRENVQNGPSTSKGIFNVKEGVTFQSSIQAHHFHMEREKFTNANNLSIVSTIGDYTEFEKKLVTKNSHNSTFQVNGITNQESESLKELEKLRAENKKLLNDFITKEGEASFLRNRLQQAQLRIETVQSEKSRLLEDQISQHKSQINVMSKEKEALKTQLDMKALEIGNLMERCKLLEGGHIKLTEPHVVNANFLMNKSRLNSSINRQSSTPKHNRLKDNSAQTDAGKKSNHVLKTWSFYYPLARMPKTVHDLAQPEERIVDLHTIEKTGRRGSPMLHEQSLHEVFDNPELLCPVTTTVGGRDLTTQFLSRDIVSLQAKTEMEIESESSIPAINKIVSTARELLLNVTLVLQTISRTIRSDDFCDHSELYSDVNVNAKCLCDAKKWHSSERGIELRRVLGILSHVSLVSTYLSKYIAGQIRLSTHRDELYKQYSEEMIRYNNWSKKGHDFEMLEMFSEFITLVGAVRRSSQFSGVISAIAAIICNVNEKLGFDYKGMQYILQIFREIIILKPLPYSYAQLSKVMIILLSSTTCLQSLCVNKSSCTFQNFLTQLQKHQHDPITRIDIVDSMLLVIKCLLHKNVVALRTGRSDSCNHCLESVRFLIKNLRRISEVDLGFVENIGDCNPLSNGKETCRLKAVCTKHCTPCLEPNAKCLSDVYRDRFTDVNFWRTVRRKQLRVLNAGLVFLSHLAMCDPNVESQAPDIEDSLHLSMQNVNSFEALGVHSNEREAIDRIKQTFMTDKTMRAVVPGTTSQIYTNLLMEDRRAQSTNEQRGTKTNHNRSLKAIQKLFNK